MRIRTPIILRSALACAALALSATVHARAPAAAQHDAAVLVQSTVEQLLDAMRSGQREGATDVARVEALVREIVLPRVDQEAVSRLVLGTHWRTATPAEQQQFQEQFRTLLVRTYSDTLSQAGEAEIEILDARDSDDGTHSVVRSRVHRGGDAPVVALGYRLQRSADGEWRVIDITIEGVSLVTTWRSEFSKLAGQHGVAGLIERLAERNARSADSS